MTGETLGDHSIPRKSSALHGGGASKWNMKESSEGVAGTPSAKRKATKVNKVGRGLTYYGLSNYDSYPACMKVAHN